MTTALVKITHLHQDSTRHSKDVIPQSTGHLIA